MTLEASTLKRRHKRCRAVSAITTTALAISQTAPSTSFWLSVGSSGTVWATTMEGTVRLHRMSRISSPSVPPYRPYSCCTMAVSQPFRAAVASLNEAGTPLSSSAITLGSDDGGPSATRTTPTAAPFASRARAGAALKVASPHGVGG